MSVDLVRLSRIIPIVLPGKVVVAVIKCVAATSCIGHYCVSISDCPGSSSCCNSKCRGTSNCWGASCSINSDCGVSETCCYGTCQYSYDDCINTTAAIIGSVVGAIVFISIVSLIIFLACRRRRRLHQPYGRVIDGQRTTAATVATTGAVQSNPPYPGQVPPSYQQGYPYQPQVQYEQPQQTTNIPPPYNPGIMAAGEQPPPYPAEPQGLSGGVYAPKTSYDAAPSAPPV